MSSMQSAPADHPGHQRGHLQPGVGLLCRRHAQMRIGQPTQVGQVGQRQHRNQPSRRHQIRVIEHRSPRPRRMRKLHPRDALRVGPIGAFASPNLPARQGISPLRHAHTIRITGGSGLNRQRCEQFGNASPHLCASRCWGRRLGALETGAGLGSGLRPAQRRTAPHHLRLADPRHLRRQGFLRRRRLPARGRGTPCGCSRRTGA